MLFNFAFFTLYTFVTRKSAIHYYLIFLRHIANVLIITSAMIIVKNHVGKFNVANK